MSKSKLDSNIQTNTTGQTKKKIMKNDLICN